MAIDARPGGPTAKRQPSPEGLGDRSRRGSERRRRGTQPIVRSPCVIPSEADLSRRAVEGSAVPRTSPGNAEYDTQTKFSSQAAGSLRRVGREMTKHVPSAISKGEIEGCPRSRF